MEGDATRDEDAAYVRRAVEASLRIGVIALILVWALRILSPFIDIVLWAAVLAVGVHPLYAALSERLGGRRKLASVLLTGGLLAIILVPSGELLATGIVEAREFVEHAQAGELAVPPPPEAVRDWPVIGETAYARWSHASEDLDETLSELQPEIEKAAAWALSALSGLTATVGQLLVALLISGVLLNSAGSSAAFSDKFARRLAGQTGSDFILLTTATIRSVFVGVLGVALIQAVLAAIGLIFVGVPGAMLWALFVLIAAVVQLPALIVLVIPIIWVVATQSSVVAVVFVVYSVIVGMSDTFLKPLLMGRGVDVPMLVILLGAIGGMLASGVIGLFVGAVVLAVAYQLMMAWLEQNADRGLGDDPASTTPADAAG